MPKPSTPPKPTKKQTPLTRIQTRMGIILTIFLVMCVIIVGRIAWFQFVRGAEYMRLMTYQSEADRTLQSPRGTILDRDGKVLAISEVAKSLYADPTIIKQPPADVAALLAPVLQLEPAEIQQKLQEDTAFVWLKRTMTHDMYDQVRQLITDHKLQGLPFMDENHRWYPNGVFASQVIGYVGAEDHGLDGMELYLDKYIRGNKALVPVTTDKNNMPILNSALEQMLPDKERTARLTLDSTIQYFVEQELDTIIATHHPVGAAIIVMDPQTGEILAMGSRPTFDPNAYGSGNAQQFRNRAIADNYEPGSTFKPIVAAAALDSGKWKLNQVYQDTGTIYIGERAIQNWDNQGMGSVTVRDILKYSINTGMVEMALVTGGPTVVSYAERFGFGKSTGIELNGEESGFLPDANMDRNDLASMGFGQSFTVTPIQMVQAFGAIANKGHMMKPFILKEISNPDGTIYQHHDPTEVGQPISEDTAKTITNILEDEMTSGGGVNAHIPGYRFAGKTGTAQKPRPGGGYAEGQYISSFMSFGPLENPRYVVLIYVDTPSDVYYGAQVAAPSFKTLMTRILQAKGIPPSQTIPQAATKQTTR